MKFMLMMNAPRGARGLGRDELAAGGPQGAHRVHEAASTKELSEAGELVDAEGLARPEQARIVRAGKDGAPEVTDGPFPESKEFLAGYWIVDVETPKRAYAIAARASAAPGPAAGTAEHADRGAPGDERPPPRRVTHCALGRRASTCCASSRRRCSARWSGASATSPPPKTRCRRRCSRRRCSGRSDGVPDNPRGWLIQVAARRMTDHIRSEVARGGAARARSSPQASPTRSAVARPLGASTEQRCDRDDTLILLFMCCHPALTPPSAIALTLRAVGGLTTAEIAKAFLVPEATMAQRISRAKQTIKTSGVPFAMPTSRERAERLERRAARALSDLQRRLHEQRRAGAAPQPISRTKRSA